MPQLYLRAVDVDSVTYTGGDLPDKPAGATDNQRGYVNEYRSKMIFKDVNLGAVVGWDVWRKADMFRIKLIDVKTVDVANANLIIDQDSPAALRSSNVMVSGLRWVNGKEKNCIGVVGNFNANNEQPYNVFYVRSDLADYTIRMNHFNYTFFGRVCEMGDLYNNFLLPRAGNATWMQMPRFRFNGAVPEYDGKIFRITGYTVINSQVLDITVQDVGDGSWPARGTVNGQNVTFTPLPSAGNSWHMLQNDERLQDDRRGGIELSFHKPSSPTVDITVELTDLLLNALQPCVVEPNGKAFPSFCFLFDVEAC